jgi:hypothetical protein
MVVKVPLCQTKPMKGTPDFVADLMVADDVTGVVDAPGLGGPGAGVIEQGVGAAVQDESVNDSDFCVCKAAHDHSAVIDA